ncbi:MAG: MerR family transcriptional regulator [Acetatifactor sp.]
MEQLLNIPRETIRFYEKEGLIHPRREGNGYRNYSGEDVECLMKIIIFLWIRATRGCVNGRKRILWMVENPPAMC